MIDFKAKIAEMVNEVSSGNKSIVDTMLGEGYSARVQRADKWNSKHHKTMIHVWRQSEPGKKARLLSKSEVASLLV